VSTIGTSSVCAPMSRNCLISAASPTGTRTTAWQREAASGCADQALAMPCSCASTERRSFGACSPSTSSQSKPVPAMISAT